MIVSRRVKRLQRGADGAAEIRLAARSRFRRELLERTAQVGVVGRERADDDAGATERDERAAVAFERVDEIGDVGLRPLKTVRPHVRREHRPRDVDRDDDIARALDRALHRLSPLRTSRGEEHKREPDENESHLETSSRHPRHGERDARKRLLAPRPQERPEKPRDRNDRRQNQKYRVDESHDYPTCPSLLHHATALPRGRGRGRRRCVGAPPRRRVSSPRRRR